jgi:hypothetical protein
MRKKAEVKDAARKRTPTPKWTEFAVSLVAYIHTVTGTCPLCGHEEEEQVSNEEESEANQTDPVHVTFGLTFVRLLIVNPEVYRRLFLSTMNLARGFAAFFGSFQTISFEKCLL